MINSQVKERKVGLMVQYTKEIIKKAKSMDSGFLNGLTAQFIKEISFETTLKDLELTFGLTIENMKVNGSQIKCMVKESFHGQMEGFMKENT